MIILKRGASNNRQAIYQGEKMQLQIFFGTNEKLSFHAIFMWI